MPSGETPGDPSWLEISRGVEATVQSWEAVLSGSLEELCEQMKLHPAWGTKKTLSAHARKEGRGGALGCPLG